MRFFQLKEKKRLEENKKRQLLKEFNKPRDDLQCDDLKVSDSMFQHHV